ncbi:hypothetical protein DFA_10343 [Cavenderia fasciculata]|uniref:Uncharacterized protein n=1 Tax=Cavenderia fasciculata TaxID=261658 RepID=F4Q9Y4_CACFS|nr:uncharacterized protein DFA_10343 [Cavenderia fasciculata]EGG15503.1 hypothetical protein DFA_10343 [Cavenderia fasciculata]|eukprot:XP_004354245.1 hypothetical protein DFA_10343 [Cavenderia fasciculata]
MDVIFQFQSIIQAFLERIINHQDPIQPRILFTLCQHFKSIKTKFNPNQDFIDRLFEKSLKSDHHYTFTSAKTLIIRQPFLFSTRLSDSIIGLLHGPDINQDTLDLVIHYFIRVENRAIKKKNLNMISQQLLAPGFINKHMTNQFINVYLFDWICLGTVGKGAVIYLPAIIKTITSYPFYSSNQDRLVRLCNLFPENIHLYNNVLVPRAIGLYRQSVNGSTLLLSIFSIYCQYHHNKSETTNQLFEQLFELFLTVDDTATPVKSLIKHAKQAGISLSIGQKKRIIDWIKSGTAQTHQPLHQYSQKQALRKYSKLIYQLALLDCDDDDNLVDYYLEISIYHVEKMLDNIKATLKNASNYFKFIFILD